MPTDEDEGSIPRSLQECSDVQLAAICMRVLYISYDHGGHSGRSIRSQLLEAGLILCQVSDTEVSGDMRHLFAEAMAELSERALLPHQRGLFKELPFLTTRDYLSLVLGRVRVLHLEVDDPSLVEGEWIDVFCRFFHSDESHGHSFTDEEIIWEGRSRVFYRNPEYRELLSQN